MTFLNPDFTKLMPYLSYPPSAEVLFKEDTDPLALMSAPPQPPSDISALAPRVSVKIVKKMRPCPYPASKLRFTLGSMSTHKRLGMVTINGQRMSDYGHTSLPELVDNMMQQRRPKPYVPGSVKQQGEAAEKKAEEILWKRLAIH